MKVLIISHNCFSSCNNMGKTLVSLFSAFPKKELCQLYVHPSVPDVDVCNSYYRITDKNALKSIFSHRKVGQEIRPVLEVSAEASAAKKIHGNISQSHYNNYATAKLLRDMVWKLSRWYTADLRRWLDREDPECIFLAPGYAMFIYDIALKISRIRKIPIITYICDDYYFVQRPKGFLNRVQLYLLKQKTDDLMRITRKLVVISEELKQRYSDHFGITAEVIMTASGIGCLRKTNIQQKSVYEISYFGNLDCNRHVSLKEFGEALDRLNKQRDIQYILNIYTSATDRQIISSFACVSSIQLKGFVSGNNFIAAMARSDFLLHTEAFDEDSIDLVRNSVSTKIAESLASGIPLIAYGPPCVSSMKHLIRNQCAWIILDRKDLGAVLSSLTPEPCNKILEEAKRTAQRYHSLDENGYRLQMLLKEILDRI